jgi:hypothetical protein
MDAVRFVALPTEIVGAYQRGEADANGRMPERQVAEATGLPCRHCLCDIEPGEEYLVLAHRPFTSIQPYAETGPIFLHARPCDRYADMTAVPPTIRERSHVLVRAYDASERIVYGTGRQVPVIDLRHRLAEMIANPQVAFVDIRSASNGCYQCRAVAVVESEAVAS